jgi:hypothetical protein
MNFKAKSADLNGDDKREFVRFEFLKLAHVFLVIPTETESFREIQKDSIEAWANDVSEGGMRLEMVQPLNLDLIYKIVFEFENKQLVEVYGRIVWLRDNHAGVRFLLADQDIRARIRAIGAKITDRT